MGNLNIIWRKRALKDLSAIADWYNVNMGFTAARKVVSSAYKTVNLLSIQPGIGIIQHNLSYGKSAYYGFPMHPLYLIIYRYTIDTLYISAIRAIRMQQ